MTAQGTAPSPSTPTKTSRLQPNRLGLIDCDIHARPKALTELKPYLSQRWYDHLMTYGTRHRHGFAKGHPYPKSQPANGARRDAFPPDGSMPGSDLAFMQAQHLDHYGIDYGIMNPLSPTGQGEQNPEFSAAMATAANEWQIDMFAAKDPRLKASVVIPYEDATASAAEIRRRAGDRNYVHVLMMSRPAEAHGRRRYWPIYEAACEAELPIGVHVFGYSGYAATNTGWCSYYIEEMTEHETSCSALVTSMIMEGVFERFPTLKVVLIEAGFAWLAALGWRLDRNWKRLKAEVPHLKKAPSEYIREHFWITTQPMEEPEKPQHLMDVMDWIGWDRVLFASDYPHWDFDDPHVAIPQSFGEERRRMIFSGNAAKLYGLEIEK
jgi:predicted TIM-barrel fold metal-dependent hydrolase